MNQQEVDERIARAMGLMLEQMNSLPAHSLARTIDLVAAKLRKPEAPKVTRRVVTFTQIGERVPMEDDWCEIGLTGQFIPGSDVASRKQSRPVFRRDESCTTA